MAPTCAGSAFRVRCDIQALECRPGRIKGYRLRFNLDGRPRGKAAPANLHPDLEAELWGVLYRITRRDLLRLDSKGAGTAISRLRPKIVMVGWSMLDLELASAVPTPKQLDEKPAAVAHRARHQRALHVRIAPR
jgi:hypothetical protein